MESLQIRTSDEREVRRLVRRGALIMAEYDWRSSGIPALEARGREWVLQLREARAVPQAA